MSSIDPMVEQYRLLIVDDEFSNINFYQVVLSKLALQIDTATSGSEAYSLLQTKKYDIMLLDLLMPGVTGIGLLQKAEREGLALPIVLVCSSVSDKSVIAQALMLGAGGYLTKPFTHQQLLNMVCDYLNLPYPTNLARVSTPASLNHAYQSQESRPYQEFSSPPISQKLPQNNSANQPLKSGRVESLSRAMSSMVFHKHTGKIEVQTISSVGVLHYEFGRLKSVAFEGKSSIEALEAIRNTPHRTVTVQI